jgi:hypothetical protein
LNGKATASILCGVPRHAKKETVTVGASIAHERVAGEAAGHEDAEEALFAAARARAEAMIAWAGSEQSLALEHEQLESETMKGGFEFMRLLTQAHLDLRAAREQRRDDVTDADGDARTICEDGHERVRVMIYGPVTTSRIAYRKKGKENLYPQDAELNWGQQSYSAGIIGRNAEAVAMAPFGQAAAQVSAQGAIHLGKRQSEELAVATAADFEAFYAARRPEPCDPATGLLLTADGSAFPVLPGALRPATAKAAAARAAAAAASGWPDDPGELRRSRKRMAELAAVADIPPAPRTPGDILAALFGTRHGSGSSTRPAPGPEAAGKTMFASVRKPAGEVIADAFAEARRRDPGHARSWFAVVDGNNHQIETITTLAADYQVKVPILIDLIHVTQYLWKAANSFFYPGDPEARAWVRDQTAKILEGKHRDVRAGIRRRASTYGYSPAERAGADECADYLEHKQDYLDYPAFLAAGWPVASGLIEGAARWIVKDRMEVTGARWGLDGAEAVLKLRALHGTGDLGDYLDYHFQQEKHRNHDSRYQQAQELAA